MYQVIQPRISVWSTHTSFQALWLDADEGGVKVAQGAGMKAILVENVQDALSKLAGLAGLQVQTFKDIVFRFLFCYTLRR